MTNNLQCKSSYFLDGVNSIVEGRNKLKAAKNRTPLNPIAQERLTTAINAIDDMLTELTKDND